MMFPRQHWVDHLDMMRVGWRQGEHVMVSGPTSSGKSTLVGQLLDVRIQRGGTVIAMLSKAHDQTLSTEFKGWARYKTWPRRGPKRSHNKIVLWPPVYGSVKKTTETHRAEFQKALDWIAANGNVCVYVDELLYMSDLLQLETPISFLAYFARSSGVSLVTSSQRPFRIPRVILSSASHAYIARTRDPDDRKRLAELGGVDLRNLAETLENLDSRHDFCYTNPQGELPAVVVNTRK